MDYIYKKKGIHDWDSVFTLHLESIRLESADIPTLYESEHYHTNAGLKYQLVTLRFQILHSWFTGSPRAFDNSTYKFRTLWM